MRESEGKNNVLVNAHGVVPLLHVGFVLIGVINTMLGPVLPLLSSRWQLDDSQSGGLFFAQSVGGMVGSALLGSLIKKFGFKMLLAGGFVLMAVGTAGLGVGTWEAGIVLIICIGISLGLTIPAINLLISEYNVGRRAAALNLLNLAWGVGAVGGPALISLLARAGGLAFALYSLAGAAVAVAVLTAGSSTPFALVEATDKAAPSSPATRLWMNRYALLTATLVFVNIGTESAMGGWIASYIQRLDPTSNFSWVAAPSLFWAGLLTGRAAAPLVLRRVRETTMMWLGMFIAVAGLLVTLLGATTGFILIGVIVAGLGLAPIFPTTIALFTERFGRDAQRMTGTLFIMAGLGAAVFPWLVGLASSRYGGLRAGLVVPMIGALAMILLQAALTASSTKDKT